MTYANLIGYGCLREAELMQGDDLLISSKALLSLRPLQLGCITASVSVVVSIAHRREAWPRTSRIGLCDERQDDAPAPPPEPHQDFSGHETCPHTEWPGERLSLQPLWIPNEFCKIPGKSCN